MRRNLQAIALAVPLILGGYSLANAADLILKGTVVGERYAPAVAIGALSSPPVQPSKYSFSLKTENIIVGIQVEHGRHVNVETIDALIQPGNTVELKLKNPSKLTNQTYGVSADNIEVK